MTVRNLVKIKLNFKTRLTICCRLRVITEEISRMWTRPARTRTICRLEYDFHLCDNNASLKVTKRNQFCQEATMGLLFAAKRRREDA